MEIISREEARQKGLVRYYTGKPCKHGHICERYINDYCCCMCVYERQKKKRQADPERHRKMQAEWRNKNRDKIREQKRARYRANPEKYRQYAMDDYYKNWEKRRQLRKDWWKRNIEKNRADQRAYYKENSEMFLLASQKWKDENRDYVRVYCNSRRHLREERVKNATPKWADTKAIAKIHRRRAKLQKEMGISLEVDHYYPLQNEAVCGLNVHNNLQIITYEENRSKGNKMPEDFYGANHQIKGIQ